MVDDTLQITLLNKSQSNFKNIDYFTEDATIKYIVFKLMTGDNQFIINNFLQNSYKENNINSIIILLIILIILIYLNFKH